jgi:hypothetical protein
MIAELLQLSGSAQESFFTFLRHELFQLIVDIHDHTAAISVLSDGKRM